MARSRLHAGRLRHRITIQEKVASQNDYGEEEITWQDVDTYWASVEPIRGREFIELRQEGAEISHRIRMRAVSGIKPAMRAIFEGRVFEIVSPPIEINERGRELHLMCNERITYQA